MVMVAEPARVAEPPSVAVGYRYVVGVDTHVKVHQYAIVEAATGRVLDEGGFPTGPKGLARAAAWIGRRTDGQVEAVLVSCEGTGSYGTKLARVLAGIGYRVVDAPSPKRDRGQDKSDTIDAIKAARGVLAKRIDRLADVRGGELQEALKVLLAARERMSAESTRCVNALNALLRGVDLGIDARRKISLTQTREISRWRARQEPPALAVARAEAVRLAGCILRLRAELAANKTQLHQFVTAHAPVLLEGYGVGPVNAAIVLSVWSHPGRIHHEAAFAKLGGTSPIQVASGESTERRLNRGGDRQLNRALHSIARTRMQRDPDTQAYIARRTQQGLTKPRIRRCLKRYIARQLFRALNDYTQPTPMTA